MDVPVPELPQLRNRKLSVAYPWALRIEDHPELWLVLPRAEWGDGPWVDEPDLVEWRAADCSYPLIIRRGGTGALCGYVGVPPEHPFHSRPKGYQGLNFSGPCDEFRTPTGEPPTCWWFGFDTADSYSPYHEGFFLFVSKILPDAPPPPKTRKKPEDYVTVDQCRAVVEALARHLQYWEDALRGKTTRDNGDGTVTMFDADGKKVMQLPDDVWEGFSKLGR